MSDWPDSVVQFEAFLTRYGLRRTRRERSGFFDNKAVEYSDGRLAVRAFSDKSLWFVGVSDPLGLPGEWYDVAIIRDVLGGGGPDALPLDQQIEYIQANLEAIAALFAPERTIGSHARLATLRRQRVQRMFPGLT